MVLLLPANGTCTLTLINDFTPDQSSRMNADSAKRVQTHWTTSDQNTQQSHQRAFHPERAKYLQLSESVMSTQPTWTAGYTLTRRDQNKSRPEHLKCPSDQFISFINICLRYCGPVETIFPVSNKKNLALGSLNKQRKWGTWKQMFPLQYQSVSQWCQLCVKGFIFIFFMHENRQGSRNRSVHIFPFLELLNIDLFSGFKVSDGQLLQIRYIFPY